MPLHEIATTTNYITTAPHFWQVLSMTIATAMFIGAALYNGELRQATKGIITIVSYTAFLLLITFARVVEQIPQNGQDFRYEQAFAGMETTLIVSLAYMLGILLGVTASRYAHYRACKERQNANT